MTGTPKPLTIGEAARLTRREVLERKVREEFNAHAAAEAGEA